MNVGVIAHDAGGAEVVARAAVEDGLTAIWAAEGPAVNIFTRHLRAESRQSLSDVIHNSQWILCGSSADSNFEWEALGLARSTGIASVVFLDHWSHYEMRFRRGEVVRMPDEIWVGDAHAYALAKAKFHSIPIRLRENPYFKTMVKSINRPRPRTTGARGSRLLYVSEPMHETSYSARDAAAFFLENAHLVFRGRQIAEIVLRPHPRELLQSYDWAQSTFRHLKITVRRHTSLEDEIHAADAVVGVGTVAMVVALLAGRPVFSSVPLGGGYHSLPYPDITYLRDRL